MRYSRLPAVSALRALESAARTGSFTRAAEELNVTQAAVSFQIRQLESDLGVQFFRRQGNTLELTDAARSYIPYVRQAFDLLRQGAVALERRRRGRALSISATQSITHRWLAHRIRGFGDRCPEYDVRIEATDEVVDFSRTETDLAIRYARWIDPALNVTLLCGDRVFPICSPTLAASAKLVHPNDLARVTLLHDDMTDITWRHWLSAIGANDVDPAEGVRFSHTGLAIDGAISGQGIALGRTILVADDIAAGRLIVPFEWAMASSYAYHVVHPNDGASDPKVQAFKSWIVGEARESEAQTLCRLTANIES